ncbi:hypothetical protein VB780_21485 [Leptolyngbya sp. CCNP1308]|nr:hypothetical protein [Leptolyngbya sp. CCNP1308]MEA5451167.1 hypothetical protein [Leptolyngbya sp. CCNP1308]
MIESFVCGESQAIAPSYLYRMLTFSYRVRVGLNWMTNLRDLLTG